MKASHILPIVLIPLALAFTSCTKEEGVADAAEATEQDANDATDAAGEAGDAMASMIEGVHSVECGCSDAVTTTSECGNYIQVAGSYLPIEGDLGLGEMEWCGKAGHKAQVKGAVKDGKFMGESLTLVP